MRLLVFALAGLVATGLIAATSSTAEAQGAQPFPGIPGDQRLPQEVRGTPRAPSSSPVETDPGLPQPILEPPPDAAQDPGGRDPGQRRVRRGPPQDGDLADPPGPAEPRDGDPAISQPGRTDDRIPDDIEAVTPPPIDPDGLFRSPGGFDIFQQIAEPEPMLDARPRRLYRFEPFAPVGIKAGKFVLFPEVEAGLAAYDNVFRTTSGRRSDAALELRPSVDVLSNWRTHALAFRLQGRTSFFAEYSSEDQRAALIEARGRLDIARRTNVEGLVSFQLDQETRSTLDSPAGARERSDIETRRAQLTLNHRFNRVSLQLRGALAAFSYGGVETPTVTDAGNDRDYVSREGTVRVSYEFKPTFSVFGETGLNRRIHERPGASDGILRDSSGERYRVGLSTGTSGQVLRGEVSLGYARQRPDDSRLQEISGVIIDANLAWRMSGLTSLLLSARSDVLETTQAGSPGGLSRALGIELRHAFRRHLIGTAGLTYTWQSYKGIQVDESDLTALVGAEYYLNRDVVLYSRLQHTWFDSTIQSRDYEATEARIGVRVRR
ncbi:MAG: outer membrane beta-barrel protein [Hyphomicrobiaceae bacterium]